MKISKLFDKGKIVYSFEVFPPKRDNPIEGIYKTLDELRGLRPDFISVTYGAGGVLAGSNTAKIASYIKNTLGIESLAHLSCVNSDRDNVREALKEFEDKGIENILALRGDIIPDVERKKDFFYAGDLITFIKEEGGDFGISAACYPEGHPEAPSMEEDLFHLREKVEKGATHLVSQLFFENHMFFEFKEKARALGVTVPIEAGIMPVTNKKMIERMVSIAGASLPAKLTKLLHKYEFDDEALREAGIAYAIDQMVDLIERGAEGIHLYTMNNPYVARKITEGIKGLL